MTTADLRARLEHAITTQAPVWETPFEASPGLVVSVSDAATVAARVLTHELDRLRGELEQLRAQRDAVAAAAETDHQRACADQDASDEMIRHLVDRATRAEALLHDLVDPDECWYDHHGGCQAHGYLSPQPGDRCPHAEAKELLAALDTPSEEATDAL